MFDRDERIAQLKKMSKEALLEHSLDLHSIVDNLDDLVIYYAQKTGELVRAHTRQSKTVDGILWGVRWQLDEVSIATEIAEKDWAKDKTFLELKTVVLPRSNIPQLEFISERTELEDEEGGEDSTIKEVERILHSQAD